MKSSWPFTKHSCERFFCTKKRKTFLKRPVTRPPQTFQWQYRFANDVKNLNSRKQLISKREEISRIKQGWCNNSILFSKLIYSLSRTIYRALIYYQHFDFLTFSIYSTVLAVVVKLWYLYLSYLIFINVMLTLPWQFILFHFHYSLLPLEKTKLLLIHHQFFFYAPFLPVSEFRIVSNYLNYKIIKWSLISDLRIIFLLTSKTSKDY